MRCIILDGRDRSMFIALELTRFLHLQAIEQQLQISPAQGLLGTAIGVVIELPLLQALAPKTVAAAIKVKHLHVSPSSIDEYEGMSAHRVFIKLVAGQGRQAIE